MPVRFTALNGSTSTIDLTGKTGLTFTRQDGSNENVSFAGKTAVVFVYADGSTYTVTLPQAASWLWTRQVAVSLAQYSPMAIDLREHVKGGKAPYSFEVSVFQGLDWHVSFGINDFTLNLMLLNNGLSPDNFIEIKVSDSAGRQGWLTVFCLDNRLNYSWVDFVGQWVEWDNWMGTLW